MALALRRGACAALALFAACGATSVVLSEYGTRIAVSRNEDGAVRARAFRHRGVDFKEWALGDPVLAAADGVVRRIRVDECAGVEVFIEHPSFRRFTLYMHLRRAAVGVGQHVKRGQSIGEVGLFRCSAGVVHVHMELWSFDRQQRRRASDLDLGPTEDPLDYDAGCYDSAKHYSSERLVLTYPVAC